MMTSKLLCVVPTYHEGGFGPWFKLDWTGHPNHSMAARHDTYTHVITYVYGVGIPGNLLESSCSAVIEEFWTLRFDGSAAATSGGTCIVLTSPDGHTTTLSHQITFRCTNNIAEYEAFLTRMVTVRNMGIRKLKVLGDSNLVARQMNGDFAVKE
ncbi:hypothetical protein TIFTF001_038716 [Ficus carica]|uniref:RNase H type-1 domain-containing protein n=1 Tax=Ficus carica TaxID=3494 RepID=A0AA88E8I7_FICCA|nr:hypothetical protein TIFTF001_038716 [Ficus carica]